MGAGHVALDRCVIELPGQTPDHGFTVGAHFPTLHGLVEFDGRSLKAAPPGANDPCSWGRPGNAAVNEEREGRPTACLLSLAGGGLCPLISVLMLIPRFGGKLPEPGISLSPGAFCPSSSTMRGSHGTRRTAKGRACAEHRGAAHARTASQPAQERRRWSCGARIVINCAKGDTNRDVAARLGVSEAMVGKWRLRFFEHRLDGLGDDPRTGAPRTATDDQVEAVVVKNLEEKPTDTTHSSTRSVAKEMGMSHTTINRIWNAFGLQPHRAELFKLSTDPFFVGKARDSVGLHLDPPERAFRALRRREVRDPGAEPLSADPVDHARHP